MSPEDMTAVVRLAHERGIWVISDECYVYLNYTGKNFSVGSLNEYRDRFHGRRIAVEDLRHDRLASGIHAGPRAGSERRAEIAEPVHLKSDVDRAESGGRCAERFAAMRAKRCARSTSSCATTW